MAPIAEVVRVGCSGAPIMQPKLASRDLIAQLRILQTDYEALRASAHEIEARGYRALLASTAFAGQAYELRDRAVELFSRLAHVFQPIEEARNIRLRLLQVSEHLASLFDENSVPERFWSERNFGAQLTGPTIRDILYAIDKQSTVHGGISLHDQMLSIVIAHVFWGIICNAS